MSDAPKNSPQPASEIILYQTEDGRNKIEVRLENETVWLTQQLMIVDEPSRLVRTKRDASSTRGSVVVVQEGLNS